MLARTALAYVCTFPGRPRRALSSEVEAEISWHTVHLRLSWLPCSKLHLLQRAGALLHHHMECSSSYMKKCA